MSIFSQRYCAIPNNETSTRVCMSHTAISPLLAVATYQKVLFYDDNSEKLDFEISRGANPTYLDWHPAQPQLAIGWSHGLITLWNEETNLAKEDSNVHKAPICNIAFNQTGSRMVTCDEKGLVAVWRGLSPLSTYQKEGPMTHTIFCELHLEKKEEKKEETPPDAKDLKQVAKKDSKKDTKESSSKSKTSNLFFFGGKAGIVCVADDSNHCTEVCKVGGSVRSLLFYEKESSIIIITSSLLLVQFKISLNEKSVPDKKVKLSIAGDPEQLTSIWVGKALLMTCSTENVLRAWHIDHDENYLMSLASVEEHNPGVKMFNDKITCVKYDEKGRVLIAGTKNGLGLFWKNMAYGEESPNDSDQWKNLPLLQVGKDEPVSQISVGRQSSMIAMKSGNNISIVYETQIRGKISDSILALQTSSKCVQIYLKRNDLKDTMFLFYGDSNIRGLDCNEKALLVWNGKVIELHEIIFDMKEPATKMLKATPSPEKTVSVGLFKEAVVICQENALVSTNFQGVVKQTINFSESEGKTIGSQLFGGFLVMWTSNNYFRVFDVSRREFKQLGIFRKFEDSTGPLGDIKTCSLNCDGSKVGIIALPKKGNSANVLMIYDLEIDSFTEHTFGLRNSYTGTWSDKRFFGVLTEYVKGPTDTKNPELVAVEPFIGKELLTFFVSSEHGIKEQDSYKLEADIEGLLGINVPNLEFIVRTTSNDINKSYQVLEQPMKDFAGIDKLDDYTKKAIMNFSFNLSISNMDEAYKCVKMIQNPQIWENMAQMCVKTKRLDVAETCLGNMRFARGAKLVREAATHDAIEPQLAMLAIQLGMKDEAAKLYQDCKRFDLLNKMYQASSEWDKAIQIAEKYDRIGLKTTYYKMAKQFEVARDFQRAIEFYEKSGNHRKEVPRMLMQAGQMQKLEEYIIDTKDKELYKWWGQYLESQGKTQNALEYYQEAESFSNVVRIMILQNNLDKALEICEHTNDPAACYYVAKQFEMRGNISEAIQLYAKAQQVSLAIRLAIENGMDNEIMTLSISGSKQVMLKAAAYFEQRNYNEKAVILYIKGNNYKKALDLSVKYKLFDYIKKITGEIDEDADPEVLANVADHFMENNQQDKAVHLLIASNQIDKALELCLEHNIPISDDMVEKFLPKKDNETQADQQKREALTRRIAKKAKKQGNYNLASHLYLQLGEKLKVAKCLVKLGDAEKIITFANNARDPQIYVLSANFLQNSDWHNSPEIMKSIIQFYSKAKAYDYLSGFYDACAAVEIDEYRDYEKALAALKEAMKYAQKVVGESREQRVSMLEKKIFVIEKFLQIRSLANSDPGEMLRQCQQLLENSSIEVAVRPGDVYAQMIEVLYDNRKLDQAFMLIKEMQKKGMIWNPYLDAEMVENIFKANGVSPNASKQGKPQNRTNMPQDEGELDEEIEEN